MKTFHRERQPALTELTKKTTKEGEKATTKLREQRQIIFNEKHPI
jgi:hypothetical protein